MGCDCAFLSKFCALYSVVGACFMLMVFMMLTHQPFFMGGIKKVELAKANAYGAMMTFVATFVISVVFVCKEALCGSSPSSRRAASRSSDVIGDGHEYRDVPTSTQPAAVERYASSLQDLPPSVSNGQYS